MNSLLVELHTEELPPKALKALSEAFAAGIEKGLRERNFLAADSRATPYATPRRLAAHITNVLPASPDEPFKSKLMPFAVAIGQDSKPTAAFLKKLASLGRGHLGDLWPLASQGEDTLVVESDGKADAVYLKSTAKGSTLVAGLQAALDETLANLPIPKLMSYQLVDGDTTVQFVRPAHRLIALHGHEVVPVQALGLLAGTKTFGHRFLAPGELAIHSAATYVKQLADVKVIASFAERRARIVELLATAAAKLNARPVVPDELLDEVTALVEWPVAYESGFEAEFLAVPQECLILTMQQNQRYFALEDAQGRLLNRFLLVSNLETADPAAIVHGNARVVRARLADAKFFFDQDRKRTLESRVPLLANVVYHNKLGSQLERVERIVGIGVAIARELGVDVTHVERAARLAKADLRTDMVGEFPELQGIMGMHYARHDGESEDVAVAIEEHYRPRFADDALPASRVGTCVALADKLETLVGLFGIGEKPTGDKDPFALRRHAIGVLRILTEQQLALRLDTLVRLAEESFGNVRAFKPAAELAAFVYDRLRGLLRDQGYTANEVEAVVSLAPQRIDLVPAQLAAVRAFMQLPEAESLAAANKRIGNILKKSAGGGGQSAVDDSLLFEPAEKDLAAALRQIEPRADQLFAQGDYTAMLKSLAPLKLPVDKFFDDVMVNVDDAKIRANRLALLAALRALMNRVADLSLLSAG
ncbi:MAG TPA: glycine--tRNA ligase subunit beta [Burkholderiaceae bacterium]|nr:glycine--tRNA ligase subunit beta [Burkholderiaceae bacterium]